MSVFMLFDDFQAIGLSMGMREVAMQDAWAQFAVYDGTARDFFKEKREDKPHWYAAPAADSVGHTAFYSLAAQGAYAKEHGVDATRELLATEGLKLGQVKAPAKADPADAIKGAENPYSDAFKGTPAERDARISSLLKSGGSRLVASLAKSAGKTVTNQPLQPVGAARFAAEREARIAAAANARAGEKR